MVFGHGFRYSLKPFLNRVSTGQKLLMKRKSCFPDVAYSISFINVFFSQCGGQASSTNNLTSLFELGNRIKAFAWSLMALGTFVYDCVFMILLIKKCRPIVANLIITSDFKNCGLEISSNMMNTLLFRPVCSIPLLFISVSCSFSIFF